MKVKPIKGSSFSSYDENPEQKRDRLINLIDELIMSSDNLTSSHRVVTSSGVININKCRTLSEQLQGLDDPRSVRISNLLDRLIKISE